MRKGFILVFALVCLPGTILALRLPANETTTIEEEIPNWSAPFFGDQSGALGYGEDAFSRPKGLEDRVEFWKEIYTKHSSYQGVLHDSRYVHLVYGVVDFSDLKDLEKENFSQAKTNSKVYRPWGNYFTIQESLKWKVKVIEVKPGQSLSLQLHKKRAEHWVVVNGTALIEKNGEKQILSENESTFIPLGCKHRLSNAGRNKLELIEVQSGTYLDEEDIIRFEDSYGRIKNVDPEKL